MAAQEPVAVVDRTLGPVPFPPLPGKGRLVPGLAVGMVAQADMLSGYLQNQFIAYAGESALVVKRDAVLVMIAQDQNKIPAFDLLTVMPYRSLQAEVSKAYQSIIRLDFKIDALKEHPVMIFDGLSQYLLALGFVFQYVWVPEMRITEYMEHFRLLTRQLQSIEGK